MPTSLVVDRLDVVEQLHLVLAARVAPLAELALESRKEPLHDGLVVSVQSPRRLMLQVRHAPAGLRG